MKTQRTTPTLAAKISTVIATAAVVAVPFHSATPSAQAASNNQNRNSRNNVQNNRNNGNRNQTAPAAANRPFVNRPAVNQPNFNPRFDTRNNRFTDNNRNNRFNNGYNNGGYSGSINLTATVVSSGRDMPLTVQDSDGNNYVIAGYNGNSFREGDRLQVQGAVKDATIQPSNVSRF